MKLKLLAFFLVIVLILIEGYLVSSSILEHYSEKKDVQTFCQIKCSYNQGSYLWEFVGETVSKGFTTKDECFNYCEKVRRGFIYAIVKDGSDFVGGLLNGFK